MHLSKKILLLVSLGYLSTAFAMVPLKCTGVDSAGFTVNINVNYDSHKLIVNDNELEILSNTSTNGSTTIVTENDVMEPTVRHVLFITGNKAVFNKINVGTNDTLSTLSLKCVTNAADAMNVEDAGTYLVTYVAEISHDDRYDDDGKRLTTVREILKQDRARFHNHLSHDAYDSDDNFFLSTAVNNLFDSDKINIDPVLEKKVLGEGNVIIKVYVTASQEINVVEYVVPPQAAPV